MTEEEKIKHREANKRSYEKHKEERRIKNKKYREDHREEILVKGKKYRDAHKEEASQYYQEHRDIIAQQKRDWKERNFINDRDKNRYQNDLEYANNRKNQVKKTNLKLRQQVIEAYGGKCEVCGISELRFLTLDHSFQDGADHRRRLAGDKVFLKSGRARSTTTMVYRDIVKRGFPKDEGYRVLCWNHNCGGAW